MAAFEDCLRRFLDHFERISNCADEDVFLKEFMVSSSRSIRSDLVAIKQTKVCVEPTIVDEKPVGGIDFFFFFFTL